MGQWVWVDPKHTIKEYYEISDEEYKAKTGKPYTVQEAIDRYGSGSFRTREQRINYALDRRPTRDSPYSEDEFKDVVGHASADAYSRDKAAGQVSCWTNVTDYRNSRAFHAALEVCPSAALLFFGNLDKGGFDATKHSPEYVQKITINVCRALACGHATTPTDAVEWAKAHK